MTPRYPSLCVTLAAGLALAAATVTPAAAEEVPVAKLAKVDVGPDTPYGELPEEAAAKRTMFEFIHMNMVERKPEQAFDRYVSRDYCNHSHLSNRGLKPCADYAETRARWVNNWSKPIKPGETIEYPTLASVNGEMVTMYGAGVDIFRVHDGKITDHWDASPPATVTVKAHLPEHVAHMHETIAKAIAARATKAP